MMNLCSIGLVLKLLCRIRLLSWIFKKLSTFDFSGFWTNSHFSAWELMSPGIGFLNVFVFIFIIVASLVLLLCLYLLTRRWILKVDFSDLSSHQKKRDLTTRCTLHWNWRQCTRKLYIWILQELVTYCKTKLEYFACGLRPLTVLIELEPLFEGWGLWNFIQMISPT